MEAPMSKKLSSDWPCVKRRPAHNLFFAILVPSPLEEDISNVFESLKQRYRVRKMQIPTPRLHVSLFGEFAGDSLPQRIVELSRLAGGAIRFVEFDMVLSRTLSFRSIQTEKPLVLAADADSARSVNRLADRIPRAFAALSGLKPPRTGPITSHLTLVWHRMTVPEQPIAPIKPPVRKTVLIHSHVGKSRYDVLGRRELVPFQ
jgi:RNA 2',3'-cyclic 3'-phosphodiesterase